MPFSSEKTTGYFAISNLAEFANNSVRLDSVIFEDGLTPYPAEIRFFAVDIRLR
jgi:hypothetical protein